MSPQAADTQVFGAFALLAVLLSAYALWLAETWTGADAARAARGGCPEGYVTAPTTQIGTVGGQGAVLHGVQCVPR